MPEILFFIKDLELGTKLKQWNILFMIKLLDYYKLYDKEGTKAPPSVTEATKIYITENDVIQKWMANALEECETPTPIDDLMDNLNFEYNFMSEEEKSESVEEASDVTEEMVKFILK